MVGGDPALVVALVGAGGGGLAAGQRCGSLLLGSAVDLHGGAAALGLREEGLDVRRVHEVEGAGEEGGQEQVQEDAVGFRAFVSYVAS